MSLYTLPNPNGLDYYTEAMIARLYTYLITRWGVTSDTYNCFGRVSRNKTEDGYIPEYHVLSSNNYMSGRASNKGGLFFDDTLAALSYIGEVDPMRKNSERDDVTRLELLFFVDLSRITPAGLTTEQQGGQRLDEVAINDVKNFVQNNGCGLVVVDTIRDVDKVIERYSGAAKKSTLSENMHPRFCFKLILEIAYNPQINVPFYPN